MGFFGLLKDKEEARTIDTDSMRDETTGVNRARFTDNYLFEVYRTNGFMKKIINAPAKDATREWFYIEPTVVRGEKTEDEETKLAIDEAIQSRLSDLNFQFKLKELIKFSRINRKGSGLYFGLDTGREHIDAQIDISKEVPVEIRGVDFVNVIDDAEKLEIIIANDRDITARNYNTPSFRLNGRDVHLSRIAWLCNDFDAEELEGASVAEEVLTAIAGQEAALGGSTTILERLGAILFKSKDIHLSENNFRAIRTLLTKVKNDLKSTSIFGLHQNDEATLLSYSFSGIKDVYEFILSNLAGMSDIPVSILLGNRGGGIVTGDGSEADLMNYYRGIEGFQENDLAPIIRKTIGLLLKEKGGKLRELTNGEMEYDIVFNSLWRLTPKEEAEVAKLKSERDSIDVSCGKITGREAAELDERTAPYAALLPDEEEDVDETTDDENNDDEANKEDDTPEAQDINE